jgi:tRNA G10  N-methylase Trm11
MINLSEAKIDGKIIDAFCGIGVILSEALLQGIKVLGIDRDKNALEMAAENLKWLKINKEKYNLIEGDSGGIKLNNQIFHSLISEPELGETLKEMPSNDKMHLILSRYENLLINVLNNLKRYVRHRFVFTAPYILTKDKRVSCNINRIANACGLKVAGSYKEFRKKQIIGREIFVLEH